MPPLLILNDIHEYRVYYEQNYCRAVVTTADGIRVYFKPQKFGHAFYENSQRRKGPKDKFSQQRAERMSWIKLTLEHPETTLYMGWNKDSRCYEENRRVSIVHGDFVVVVELSINLRNELKGNFVTCYVADKSIQKIMSSPLWNKDKCLEYLKNK